MASDADDERSNAETAGMKKALHLSSGDYQWLLTIFYLVGYGAFFSPNSAFNALIGLHRIRALHTSLEGFPAAYLGVSCRLWLGSGIELSRWCTKLARHDGESRCYVEDPDYPLAHY